MNEESGVPDVRRARQAGGDGMTAPIGPYMNEDGIWWVPVEAASFRQARRAVVACIQFLIPDEGTLRYEGKEMAWLDSEHEAGCERDCPSLRHVLAWRFSENPR